MENSIYRICSCCGKGFRCNDGDYTCSRTCADVEEGQEVEGYAKERED